MHEAYVGVDLGTQGVRAVLVAPDGQVLGSGSAPLRSDVRDGDLHEQDPREWWSATCTATRAALAGHAGPVGAVSIDSTSGTFVVQDDEGLPVGPGVMYDDRRGAAEAERVQEAGAALWDALGYRMQASWALPKLVALGVPAGRRVAHQADHVAGRLAGRPVATDTSHALKTGYDLLGMAWPTGVLDELGVDPAVLPPVVLPGEKVGEVTTEETGIPAGTPIRAGMTDGCAAQVAAAALAPGDWCTALGTTLVLKGSTRELLHDPSGAVYCHRNPDGGWLPGGASSTGAGAVARELAGADLDALTARSRGRGVPAGATYPLVGTGERFPFVADSAEGFDLGSPDSGSDTDPATRFHRIAHGVAYVERLAFDVLAGLGADVSGTFTATGGATRNDWWTQLRADVLQRPLAVPEQSGSAFGSAIVAAAPASELAATARAMVRVRRTFEPDPARADELTGGYERLVGALRERGWVA